MITLDKVKITVGYYDLIGQSNNNRRLLRSH
jgi:hypothetical protein